MEDEKVTIVIIHTTQQGQESEHFQKQKNELNQMGKKE